MSSALSFGKEATILLWHTTLRDAQGNKSRLLHTPVNKNDDKEATRDLRCSGRRNDPPGVSYLQVLARY